MSFPVMDVSPSRRQAIELVTLYDDDMITSAYVYCLPPIDGIIKVETKKRIIYH
jgi:hypothetical protein